LEPHVLAQAIARRRFQHSGVVSNGIAFVIIFMACGVVLWRGFPMKIHVIINEDDEVLSGMNQVLILYLGPFFGVITTVVCHAA
jgi:hypothetical protein